MYCLFLTCCSGKISWHVLLFLEKNWMNCSDWNTVNTTLQTVFQTWKHLCFLTPTALPFSFLADYTENASRYETQWLQSLVGWELLKIGCSCLPPPLNKSEWIAGKYSSCVYSEMFPWLWENEGRRILADLAHFGQWQWKHLACSWGYFNVLWSSLVLTGSFPLRNLCRRSTMTASFSGMLGPRVQKETLQTHICVFNNLYIYPGLMDDGRWAAVRLAPSTKTGHGF